MGIDDLLKEKRGEILRVAARRRVGSVRGFGSVARGEAGEHSDVDLLIEVIGPTTPWFPGGLVADLEQLLGRRADVVEAKTLREVVRNHVLPEAVPL
jgi:predicted nucleotidyltransferase